MPRTSVEAPADVDREPTADELAAIETEQAVLTREWALIEARLAAVERPGCQRAARRVRRAAVRLLAAHRDRANLLVPPEWGGRGERDDLVDDVGVVHPLRYLHQGPQPAGQAGAPVVRDRGVGAGTARRGRRGAAGARGGESR